MERERFRAEATNATLCFIFDEDEILLIEKKRGVGQGLYNGPGGKIEEDETPEECAIRETQEEVTVEPKNLEKVGELEFIFGDEPFMFVNVFKAEDYSGTPSETKEARPEWFPTAKLPYETMWSDDKYWFPKMLKGEKFLARFHFDEEGDKIQDYYFEKPDF